MKSRSLRAMVLAVCVCGCVLCVAPRAQEEQDRYALKALNGVAFSEFRGYEDWKDVAVSETKTSVKAILANDTMIQAYRSGIPGNGQPFPDGSQVVKIEWLKKVNPVAQYFVEVPDTLKSVSFIEKDSKRFPDTHGWGYAQFLYDPATKTFKPYGENASFGKAVCFQCHTAVASTDYIFTRYPER
jgi:hypothetical protein